jgi:periplasmic glucans biosynthesis protein
MRFVSLLMITGSLISGGEIQAQAPSSLAPQDAPYTPLLPTEGSPDPMEEALPQTGIRFDKIRSLAAERAAKPFVERRSELAPYWRELKRADYAKIQFRHTARLWRETKSVFQLEMIHPGRSFTDHLMLSQIIDGEPAEIPWSGDYFNYQDLAVPADATTPPGYAGFKVFTPLEQADSSDEWITFDGNSFFRAIAPGLEAGVTARGVAINTAVPEGEEFPAFERIWLHQPKEDAKHLNLYALLDGPSVVGAYRFRFLPGRSTVIEVDAELTLRQETKRFGLAPLSTMFWFGELTHPKPLDYRPEVHNSDGLLVHTGDGNAIWNPLDQSATLRHTSFSADKFHGFGLIQRDRQFHNYQDVTTKFHRRPSAYIEPVGKWPAGTVHLLELPTQEPHWDNVVTFWEPKTQPKPGQPIRLGYRIHWLGDMGVPGLAKVIGTRRSQTNFKPEEKRPYQAEFVVDFAQLSNPEDDQREVVLAVEATAGGLLLEKNLLRNPETGGWRATFRVQLEPNTESIEVGCRLLANGRIVSERWNYTWKR